MTAEVVVEPGGAVLRGIAVPYGEPALVVGPTPRGKMLHAEVFDDQSILDVGALFNRPLLVGHDQNRPIGRVRLSRSTPVGLEIEADLLVGDDEIEGFRRRAGAGVQRSLSVGFFASPNSDIWSRGKRSDEPLLVLRRGVEIKEVSLVVWPAYKGALVSGIHERTRVGEQRRLESQRVIAEALASVAAAQATLAKRSKSPPNPERTP